MKIREIAASKLMRHWFHLRNDRTATAKRALCKKAQTAFAVRAFYHFILLVQKGASRINAMFSDFIAGERFDLLHILQLVHVHQGEV